MTPPIYVHEPTGNHSGATTVVTVYLDPLWPYVRWT